MQTVQNDPVTDIKIVCQRERSPAGYYVLEKTVQGHDGQLFDSTWRHKGKRFLCYSKQPGSHVIVDMSVINEGDPVTNGYTAISNTLDDVSEKAFRKHQLCIRVLPKDQATQAICDMTLVNKSKGEIPPPGYYTITNDVNELYICFRMGQVMRYRPPPGPAAYSYSSAPHAVGPNRQQWNSNSQAQGQSMPVPWQQQQNAQTFPQYTPHHAMPAAKSSAQTGIEGLPFQINSKFDILWKKSGHNVTGVAPLTTEDIKSKYTYDFSQEWSVLPG